MLPTEKLACFQKDRMREFETGRFQGIFPKEREAAHKDRTPHLVVRVFAIHQKTRQYLLQKRGPHRSSYPNMFTDSASGHVDYREHFQFEHIVQDAKRELQEEMGVTPLVFTFWETEFREAEQELEYCFFSIVNDNPAPDVEEVDIGESKFYTEDQLNSLLIKKEFIPHVKEMWAKILTGHLLTNFLDQCEKCQSPLEGAELGPGVIIGRFQPFHRGHIALVKEIVRRQGKIIIIIGSKQYSRVAENPFTSEERIRMVRKTLQGYKIPIRDVKIYAVEDKHDAPKWTEETCALLPPNAVIYSNSEWIRELFRLRGFCLAEFVKFNFEEFNGTAIRTKLYAGQDWKPYVPYGTKQVIEEILHRGLIDKLITITPTKRRGD